MKYESTRKAISKYKKETHSVLVFFSKEDEPLFQKVEEKAKEENIAKSAYIRKILRETLERQHTKQT